MMMHTAAVVQFLRIPLRVSDESSDSSFTDQNSDEAPSISPITDSDASGYTSTNESNLTDTILTGC